MMHFDLIEMVTPTGSRSSPNEDRAGVGPKLARVIDGATETARAVLTADPDFLSKPISPEILGDAASDEAIRCGRQPHSSDGITLECR